MRRILPALLMFVLIVVGRACFAASPNDYQTYGINGSGIPAYQFGFLGFASDLSNTTLTANSAGSRLCDATSGTVAETLPAANTCGGKVFWFSKIDSSGNAVNINRAGSDTINGGTTVALAAQFNYVALISDGVSKYYELAVTGGGGGGGGSITGAGSLSPLFTTGVSGSTITFSLSTATNPSWFGCNGSTTPAFQTSVLPSTLVPNINLNNQSLVASGIATVIGPLSTAVTPLLQALPAQNSFAHGKIQSYSVPTANAHCLNLCEGPDGNIWGIEHLANNIFKITENGTATEFTLPTNSGTGPLGICAGSDGNLWFCCPGLGKIGRCTPTGTITEFTGAGVPFYICAGSDNNLWFVDPTNNKIGRCTPTGTITTFSTLSASPQYICAGPDGALWYTTATAVGRCTTAGVVSEFSLPGPTPFGQGICTGRDGNLWLCDGGNNAIAQCTTAGVITEFPCPTGSADPLNIASGPDGLLYFSENQVNKIGWCTTSGVITEIASGVQSCWVAFSASGNLWVGGQTASSVAVLPLIQTTSVNGFAGPITTIAGSSSGNYYWSMPEQGAGYKKFVLVFSGCTDAGGGITFPTAFNFQPSVTGNGTGLAISTLSTTSITIPASTAATGVLVVEGI